MTTHRHNGVSWNLGGLLGSAFGCSAWMALTPFLANWHSTGIVAALGCSIVIMLTVPLLWPRRTRIGALQGMFIFLAVALLATCSFLLYAHFMGLPLLVSWPPPVTANALEYFWILLLFPALTVLFRFADLRIKAKSEHYGSTQPATHPESK